MGCYVLRLPVAAIVRIGQGLGLGFDVVAVTGCAMGFETGTVGVVMMSGAVGVVMVTGPLDLGTDDDGVPDFVVPQPVRRNPATTITMHDPRTRLRIVAHQPKHFAGGVIVTRSLSWNA